MIAFISIARTQSILIRVSYIQNRDDASRVSPINAGLTLAYTLVNYIAPCEHASARVVVSPKLIPHKERIVRL